jgi:hypothetical protein
MTAPLCTCRPPAFGECATCVAWREAGTAIARWTAFRRAQEPRPDDVALRRRVHRVERRLDRIEWALAKGATL